MLNPFSRKLDETLPDWYVDLLVAVYLCNMLLLVLDGIGLVVVGSMRD